MFIPIITFFICNFDLVADDQRPRKPVTAYIRLKRIHLYSRCVYNYSSIVKAFSGPLTIVLLLCCLQVLLKDSCIDLPKASGLFVAHVVAFCVSVVVIQNDVCVYVSSSLCYSH